MPTRRDLDSVGHTYFEALEVTGTLFDLMNRFCIGSGWGESGNPLSLILENEVNRCRLVGVYELKAKNRLNGPTTLHPDDQH
jgi:hypothetical protein